MFVQDAAYGQTTPIAVVEQLDNFQKLDKNRARWLGVLGRKENNIENKQSNLRNQLEKQYKKEMTSTKTIKE